MALFKKKDGAGSKHSRLFFATDIHGSERTFRKFVNCAKFYKVDHIIMGGDIMGKFLVPIVARARQPLPRDACRARPSPSRAPTPSRRSRSASRRSASTTSPSQKTSCTPCRPTRRTIDATFHRLARERIERWIALADERLERDRRQVVRDRAATTTRPTCSPSSTRFVASTSSTAKGGSSLVDDIYPMANCGYSNPTPWDTPREVDEDGARGDPRRGRAGHRRLHERHLQPARAALRLHARRLPQARLVDRPALADRRRRRAAVGARRQHGRAQDHREVRSRCLP